MAQLKSGSTVGGSLIGFPVGTVMVFYQAAAPTGWTQVTTQNNKGLRVVSGTGGGTGGTHAFSSPPSTSHTHSGPSHTHSTPNHSHSHTLSAGAHTLSTAEMPSHTHSSPNGSSYNPSQPIGAYSRHGSGTPLPTNATGGNGSHSHSLAGSISSGGAGTSGAGGTGNTGAGGTGATSSAGPTAFAPQYIDVIVCTKD